MTESMGPNSLKKVEGRGTSPQTLITRIAANKAAIAELTKQLAPQFQPHAHDYVDMTQININEFGEIERASV